MLAPGRARNAVAVGIGSDQHHRAMATKMSLACLLVGFALVCALENTEGFPSVDPPVLYPAGLRRSADPTSAESDEVLDDSQGPPAPPAPPVSPVGPSVNPLFPLIRMKPGKLGPVVDPTQFIQMKADLLKNLFGPGGAKSPVARAVSSGPSKWAGGAAWASGSAAAAEKWGAKSKAGKVTKPTQSPVPPSPWDWPPPAPAAPAAPAAPQAPVAWAPAPAPVQALPPPPPVSNFPTVPGYWIPSSVFPVPADPTDKKAALVEALLDNLLSQPSQASALRMARAPLAGPASSGPSPYLTDLLDSLNLTLPAAPPTLKPTIEPPGFWFPSYVPAAPGSLTPFVVDPSAQIAKKTKFLSDLFTSKAAAAAAAAAASPAASPSAALAARGIDPSEYTAKVSSYIDSLLDSTTATSKRASGVAPKKSKPAKLIKAAKTSKVATQSAAAAPTNPPVIEEVPEDEVALDQILGLRKKRDVEDETETEPDVPEVPEDETTPDDAAEKAKTSAAILNDMATVKQNILIQLAAMSKAESAASKAAKAATKAAKKASTLATLLNLPVPTMAPVSTVPITDFQQKIAVLTNIYSTLSDTQKNLTSAPDANDPLNPDKLFIAAVNAKVNKILLRNALLPTGPKVARSSNWQRWRGQQDSDVATQYEADNETSRRQKSAVPLVAAVFAPQTHHYLGRQPNW